MRPRQVTLLLMAAGRSKRFGADDKLTADLCGKALGLHVAERLADMGWAQKIAVADGDLVHDLRDIGFDIIAPQTMTAGLGDNLSTGTARLRTCDAVLIVLSDMPFVSKGHVDKLLEAATGDCSIVASGTARVFSPPILLKAKHFDALTKLSGDVGAKKIISESKDTLAVVKAADDLLFDCDTPDAFEYARQKILSKDLERKT